MHEIRHFCYFSSHSLLLCCSDASERNKNLKKEKRKTKAFVQLHHYRQCNVGKCSKIRVKKKLSELLNSCNFVHMISLSHHSSSALLFSANPLFLIFHLMHQFWWNCIDFSSFSSLFLYIKWIMLWKNVKYSVQWLAFVNICDWKNIVQFDI